MQNGILDILAGALALLPVAAAQAPAPLISHSLDDDAAGWTGAGTNARVTITQQTSFNGKGALKFEYDVKKGMFSALVLPTPDAALAKAKTFRFWVNADYPTSLAMILQEKDGARYFAPFAVPKGKWQKVELSSTDFARMEGMDNPPDANNTLDMDQVAAVAIADVGQFFALAGNADLEKLLNAKTGAHVLHMDDFTVTGETLPGAFSASNGEVRIDTFARPQIGWLTVGGVTLSRLEAGAQGERGLQADYQQAPARLSGIMRFLPKGKLQGVNRLSFNVASMQAVMLLVQLEESGGGKFNMTVDVPEGGAPKAVTVELESLNPADESTVKDRKIRPELVTGMVLLDASGLLGMTAERDNTLRVTGLRAVTVK